MRLPRASGILLHPTSLPGKYGIGDLGASALDLCDTLAAAGQTYWQMLPLGPTGYGDSPYSSFSAFAGNTLLISPEALAAVDLIDEAWLAGTPEFPADRVDYGAVYEWKTAMLSRAFSNFTKNEGELFGEFSAFCENEGWWLDDYALYKAIQLSQGQAPWYEWPDELRRRDDDALSRSAESLAGKVREQKFYQFLFFRQWADVRSHAASLGLKIIGDVPIFVARDSADLWIHQREFKLNADGSPEVVAGVPPDFFSKTGQLWGNPICDWPVMADDGFAWWVARFQAALAMYDVVRIDHFRGFESIWEVPGGDATAERGQWVKVPGREIFERLTRELGDLPVIAEDLGFITPEVEQLRDEFEFPGMRILQYGFGGDADNRDLPHNYPRNSAAYTGTHDNDTIAGWFDGLNSDAQTQVMDYAGGAETEMNWAMLRLLWSSVADTVIVPVQDILGLNNDAKMNLPGSTDGNWKWRMPNGAPDTATLERLRHITSLYGRERK